MQLAHIRKAVIAAAGMGTRMHPITKVIEKAMLPVGRFPAIDYIVHECAAAGIEELAIVIKRGNDQIRRYYSDDDRLLDSFTRRGWSDKSATLRRLGTVPSISFIEQSFDDGYGTGVPVALSREFVGSDNFFFISSDDLLIDNPGTSTLTDLGEVAAGGYGIVGYPAPDDVADHYGFLDTTTADGTVTLRGLIEAPGMANCRRSRLINISRYVFPAEFVEIARRTRAHIGSKEVRITDALLEVLRSGLAPVRVHITEGKYFDLGEAPGVAEAFKHIASAGLIS
jgi:UTP--glucose-1-phosphate uridylyltransferase